MVCCVVVTVCSISSISSTSTAHNSSTQPPWFAVCFCVYMQTGTAERFSKQLGNELRRKYGENVAVEVVDIENYKAEKRLPRERLVLYLMATYGAAQTAWRFG